MGSVMIDINKKYKTAHGLDVIIYAIYPKQLTKQVHGALVYADGEMSTNAWNINGTFLSDTASSLDLVEVIPYSGWDIDDKVIVTFDGIDADENADDENDNFFKGKEYKYYFAGLNGLNQPCVFSSGSTSWSNRYDLIPVTTIRKFEEQ
jgi:hypothetical protein